MADTITITIKNRSTAELAFLLFQTLTTPSGIYREEVFTHRSSAIGGNANDQVTFQISKEYFGVHGTNMASPNERVKICTTGYSKATLQSTSSSGAVNGSTFYLSTLNRDGVFPIFKHTAQTTTAKQAFTIRTDEAFGYMVKDSIYLGVGATDPKTGRVIPIQTHKAEPNFTTVFYPQPRYYIRYGNFELGSVVKKFEMGRVLCLDFTGTSLKDVAFTLDEHDEYQIDPAKVESSFVWKSEIFES
ncbi:unnamed protein product [Fusarium graminearum]|uniref:Uncharacterized protein n=1 Tax=Gibberella zeae TaxID=5518 RepID=A0A9N8NAS9_GIBZA|nr:unnamed protein product [Fusarium graminearum]CAG2011379.1 unnamed protein product [Fusarium graminearum]